MKHAYLIMAHNEPYILEKLLRLIDDQRNDIYLHIDKKWKSFDFDYFKNVVQKSNIYFTKRLDVRWGTYSQIECELLLFETASKKEKYSYYHVLSGVDMPLTSQNVIHNYFENNCGKEFICFDYHDKILPSVLDRIKYYHFFIKNRRSSKKITKKIYGLLYKLCLKTQKIFKVNRLKKTELSIRKGANWVSITDDLVQYLLSQKKLIRKMFRHSFCADEIFLQTIVYNSEYYNHLISYKDDDNLAIKRYIDWKRGEPYTFSIDDFNELINSNCFFARKFSMSVDKKIIDKLYDYLKGK